MKFIIGFITRFIPRKYLQTFSGFFRKLLAFFYKGNTYECPVCGKHYRKMLPYGRIVSRKNALCPNCLSLERHRLIWLYLKGKTNFFTSNLKVLHIAPEFCFLKRFAGMKNIEYISADLESPWAKVKMDVRNIPFDDNTFDVVICNHLLEHIDDETKALKEIYRIMKPGSWGIMQVPLNYQRQITYEDASIVSEKEREKAFGQRDHVREYGLDYPEHLRKGGFTVIADDYVKHLPDDLVKRYALSKEEIIFLVKK